MVSGVESILPKVLERAFYQVSSAIKRLDYLADVFDEDEAIPKKLIKKAVRDLKQILGTRHGGLTTEVASLFDELTNSGILTTLVEQSLLFPSNINDDQASLPGLQGAFNELFAKHIRRGTIRLATSEADAATFFTILRRTLLASIRSQDSFESHALFANQERAALYASLSKIDRALSNIYDKLRVDTRYADSSRPLERDRYESLLNSILDIAEAQNGAIWIFGHDDKSRRVRLDDIFIPLKLSHRTSPRISQQQRLPLDAEPISYNDAMSSRRRAVLLGDPGSGKTTVSQKLVLEQCNRARSGTAQIPIRLVVRDYDGARAKGLASSPLPHIIERWVAADPSLDWQECSRFLSTALRTGNVLLIIDGLDEVLDPSRRSALVDELMRLLTLYPLCNVFVTSREVGYEKAPMPRDFDHFVLCRLEARDARDYFKKLSALEFGVSSKDATKASESFFNRIGDESQELVLNPLMLTLMCFIFHDKGGEIPANRARIYEECSILMFKRWDERRSIVASSINTQTLFSLITVLAKSVIEDPALSSYFGREWLFNRCKSYFIATYADDAEQRANAAAESVVSFLLGRAWVLMELGADRFSFTHKTFLEYFHARSLNDEHATVSETFDNCWTKISNGQWHVQIHLALQLKVRSRFAASVEITDALVSRLGQGSPTADALRFATQALDYVSPQEAQIAPLMDAVMPEVIRRPEARLLVDRALGSLNEGSSFIAERLAAHCVSTLISNASGISPDLIDDIFVCTRPSLYFNGQQSHFTSFAERVVSQLSRCDPTKLLRQPHLAKLWFDLTGLNASEVARFGAELWIGASRIHQRRDFCLFDLAACIDSLVIKHQGTLLGGPYADLAIHLAPALLTNAMNEMPRGDRSLFAVVRSSRDELRSVIQNGNATDALALYVCCRAYMEMRTGYPVGAGTGSLVRGDWGHLHGLFDALKARDDVSLLNLCGDVDEGRLTIFFGTSVPKRQMSSRR